MRKRRTTRLVVPALAAALACSLAARAADNPPRVVVDQLGREVHVPIRIERVISLAPNLTEMVYALGAQSRLVGVTNLCDYPPSVREKARVGDVLNPSLETIIELKPDVVLGSTAGNRRETVEALERAGVPLYGVDADTVEGILASIRNVAVLLDVPERGEALTAHLEQRLAALSSRLETAPRPRILFVLWLEPLLTVGGETFLNDVLAHAGAESIATDLRQDWPRLNLETVIERDPDFLVLPRAMSLEARFADLSSEPPWSELRPVREKRVLWVDESVLRPGPRIVDAIEELARALHPEQVRQEAGPR